MNCLEVLLRSFTISRYARLGEPTALARTGQKVIVVPGADTSRVNITNFSQTQRLMRDSREISSRFLSLGGWETAA
jgi:hypothetical protein